jgi:two-component sensor histidine kinase
VFRLYDINNGLPDNDLTAVFEKDTDGYIYIGTPGKMTVFDPLSVVANRYTAPPIITSVFVNNAEMSLSAQKMNLRYDQSIGFNFVSLNYTNAENNNYAYQLKGFKDEWVNIGNRRELFFPGLPPGEYLLRLKAANNEGVWDQQVTEYPFKITPPFWKTAWFIGGLTLLFLAAIYLLYRYRINQLLRIEKMRTRIATDLHDDIGATLSSISFYSEAIKQKTRDKLPEVTPTLEKMGETSRSMVNSISDIVWAINPRNDDMDKLIQRMQSHAAELCALKNIHLKIDSDEKPGDAKPRLEQRKNIYLIFKEALNNSLKYSHCSNIWLSMKLTGNVFSMQVRDDGTGFENNSAFGGNGLHNMRLRADEIGGKLTVNSRLGDGTSVSLVVKIT